MEYVGSLLRNNSVTDDKIKEFVSLKDLWHNIVSNLKELFMNNSCEIGNRNKETTSIFSQDLNKGRGRHICSDFVALFNNIFPSKPTFEKENKELLLPLFYVLVRNCSNKLEFVVFIKETHSRSRYIPINSHHNNYHWIETLSWRASCLIHKKTTHHGHLNFIVYRLFRFPLNSRRLEKEKVSLKIYY